VRLGGLDDRAGEDQAEGTGVPLLVAGEQRGQHGGALVAIDPPEADQVGDFAPGRRPWTTRVGSGATIAGAQVRIVHAQTEEQLVVGCHRERPLHQVPLCHCLENQAVGRLEHPGEDRQAEGGLVVGRRMENRRDRHLVDDPHRRVVEVRIEDEHVRLGVDGGIGHCRRHRPLQVDPSLGVLKRCMFGVRQQ